MFKSRMSDYRDTYGANMCLCGETVTSFTYKQTVDHGVHTFELRCPRSEVSALSSRVAITVRTGRQVTLACLGILRQVPPFHLRALLRMEVPLPAKGSPRKA